MQKLLLICGFVFAGFTSAHGVDDHISTGNSEAAAMIEAGDKYHQSISIIRKLHPEFLLHKRDKTLRQGVRTKEKSLVGCIHCHASKNEQTGQFYPINKSGQFCATCHQKVAISVDCFGCHRTTPDPDNISFEDNTNTLTNEDNTNTLTNDNNNNTLTNTAITSTNTATITNTNTLTNDNNNTLTNTTLTNTIAPTTDTAITPTSTTTITNTPIMQEAKP